MKTGTVWITGTGGLIGSHLLRLASEYAPERTVIGLTRNNLDLTDFDALRTRYAQDSPALVIHCAALSHSGLCEQDPTTARAVNVDVPAMLAILCTGSRLVLFSTDLVFDGAKGKYTEADPVNPLNVYAQTKVEAEGAVRAIRNHLVIRTSLNCGSSPGGNRGFDETMKGAWKEGKTLRLFTDEFRSPIHASITARATWELALSKVTGICHVAGNERMSRWEIGQLVAERCAELHPRIVPVTRQDYKGPPRPADTSLNCSKVQKRLSFRLPRLTDWLASNPAEAF